MTMKIFTRALWWQRKMCPTVKCIQEIFQKTANWFRPNSVSEWSWRKEPVKVSDEKIRPNGSENLDGCIRKYSTCSKLNLKWFQPVPTVNLQIAHKWNKLYNTHPHIVMEIDFSTQQHRVETLKELNGFICCRDLWLSEAFWSSGHLMRGHFP